MVTLKCVAKERNKYGTIVKYALADRRGRVRIVGPQKLKIAILTDKVNVVNLKLTSDGKLISKGMDKCSSEEQFDTINRDLVRIMGAKWILHTCIANHSDNIEAVTERININGIDYRVRYIENSEYVNNSDSKFANTELIKYIENERSKGKKVTVLNNLAVDTSTLELRRVVSKK